MGKAMKERAAPLAVALATFIVYQPALRNGFVNWDDYDVILDNPHIRGLGWADIKWMFTTLFYSTYQPFCWLIDAALYRLQGLDPFGFHAVSLFFHCANAVAMYHLTADLLKRTVRDLKAVVPCAAIAALGFALHPMHVEDVAWADGLADLMSIFFFLVSILAYLRAADSGSRGWLAASWGLFAASALSRWRGISLPLVLLALDAAVLRRKARWVEKAPYFAISALLLLVTAQAKYQPHQYGMSLRPREAAAGFVFYLGHWLAPAGLVPVYILDGARNPQGWPFLWNAGLLLAVTAGLLALRRRFPAGLAVWFCYLVSLAPRLAVAPEGPIFVHDQYGYHACLGFFLLAAAGLARLSRTLRLAVAGAFLPLMAVMSWGQIKVWHDPVSLWNDFLRKDPDSSVAHTNLGNILMREGRYEEALWHFRLDYRNNPHDYIARLNLGNFLSSLGPLKPDWAKWHNNLGADLFKEGDLDSAFWHLTRSIQLNPRSAETHNNLGILFSRRGQAAEALAHYSAALKLAPRDAQAHNNMGSMLARLGRPDEARAQFEEALRIAPGYGDARENLERLKELRGP